MRIQMYAPLLSLTMVSVVACAGSATSQGETPKETKLATAEAGAKADAGGAAKRLQRSPEKMEVAEEKPISYAIPSGDADELLAFIESIRDFQPRTPLQATEHRRKAPAALTTAAKRIISIEKEQWSRAYQTALVVLLRDRIRLLIGATRVEQQQTMDLIKTFLTARSEKAIRVEDVRLAAEACQTLERSGNFELAAKSYSDLAELVGRQKDDALAVEGAMLEGAARRLGLPGKPLELHGTTKIGTPLDWSAYRGKVVLVSFLSAGSSSCRDEMWYAKAAFRGYGDRGFDVLIICTDPEHEALEKLLNKEELPWGLVRRGDPKAASSSVVGLGASDAPVSILVDKQGVDLKCNRHSANSLPDRLPLTA